MHIFSEDVVSDVAAVAFDGLIAHDGSLITDANERAARIFGFDTAESMVGLPYTTLLAPSARRSTQMRITSGTEGRYSTLCRHSNGSNFVADINTREMTYKGSRTRLVAIRHSANDDKPIDEALIHRSLALDQTVTALATTIEQRDMFTAGHQSRVSQLGIRIARALDMSDREITTIRIAGNIHDIGKISIPAEILMKPGRLTHEEFNLIKIHPSMGSSIVKTVDFDGPVGQTILQHHERLDGSGYPNAIKDPIPEARVIAAADVYDAMTSDRPYRAGIDPARALSLMHEEETGRLDANALEKLASVVLPSQSRTARTRQVEGRAAPATL
ncbi:MAG: HD domain-containing phosphohydrolase [Arenicellales bacterium]